MKRVILSVMATLMFVLASSSLGSAASQQTGPNQEPIGAPAPRPAAATDTNVAGTQNLPSTSTSSSDAVGLGLFVVGAVFASGVFALTFRRRTP